MLVYLRDKPEGEALKTRGLRVYTWKSDDPLADVFLIQLGAYPDPKETGIEYLEMLTEAAEATEHQLESEIYPCSSSGPSKYRVSVKARTQTALWRPK